MTEILIILKTALFKMHNGLYIYIYIYIYICLLQIKYQPKKTDKFSINIENLSVYNVDNYVFILSPNQIGF